MLKKLLLSAALASLAGYCYSESIVPYSGVTPNAAAGGNTWNMDNILPQGVPGLDINLIIYSYTPQKQTEDDMVVHIQNKNSSGTGYIFRESDDWSGLPGGTKIRKAVPVLPSNRSLWGDGSIEIEGEGTVEEPFVFYNYRVDPCYDPQFDPNCPGYQLPEIPQIEIPVVDIEIYDATQDEYVNLSSEETVLLEENEEVLEELDEEEEEEAEKKKRAYRLAALEASNAAMLFAENQRILQMNQVAQQAVDAIYMPVTINGGVYKDALVMQDKKLPTNPRGLRNGFAQQLLHEKMVEMQYNKKK